MKKIAIFIFIIFLLYYIGNRNQKIKILEDAISLDIYTEDAKKYRDSTFYYLNKNDSLYQFYKTKCENSLDTAFFYEKKLNKNN
ncbi:MAG TPA: hypothetical protein PKL13_04350 [bacterium]|nr:hypothetical protein [bacterium]